jgi:hypothetical protein
MSLVVSICEVFGFYKIQVVIHSFSIGSKGTIKGFIQALDLRRKPGTLSSLASLEMTGEKSFRPSSSERQKAERYFN